MQKRLTHDATHCNTWRSSQIVSEKNVDVNVSYTLCVIFILRHPTTDCNRLRQTATPGGPQNCAGKKVDDHACQTFCIVIKLQYTATHRNTLQHPEVVINYAGKESG